MHWEEGRYELKSNPPSLGPPDNAMRDSCSCLCGFSLTVPVVVRDGKGPCTYYGVPWTHDKGIIIQSIYFFSAGSSGSDRLVSWFLDVTLLRTTTARRRRLD